MPRWSPVLNSRAIAPMEARLVDALPEGEGWQFEPKWDGFRCLAFRDGERVELVAKSGILLRPSGFGGQARRAALSRIRLRSPSYGGQEGRERTGDRAGFCGGGGDGGGVG